MKVFISWSGDTSKPLAAALRDWLPGVIQAVRPYFSPDDVAKGARWSTEIAQELHTSSFGILVVTPDNFTAPWLVFEAGALSKSIDKAKVCPLLFGMDPTDVTGPLSQFQASRFERSEVEQLMRSINKDLGERALSSEVFSAAFDLWWPRLEAAIAAALTERPVKKETRTPVDLLEEVLALTRSISTTVQSRGGPRVKPTPKPVDGELLDRLLNSWRELIAAATSNGDADVMAAILTLRNPLGMLVRRTSDSATGSLVYAAAAELSERMQAHQQAQELRSLIQALEKKLATPLDDAEREAHETLLSDARKALATTAALINEPG